MRTSRVSVLLSLSILLGACGDGDSSRTMSALTREQLSLASQTVVVEWRSDAIILKNGHGGSLGSCGVIWAGRDVLSLITNAHCLALEDLGSSTYAEPKVLAYDIRVQFASGATKRVLRFGRYEGSLDLALLEVDSSGLAKGTDYVVLPYGGDRTLTPGDEVVVVGSPSGFSSTQTFGRVSALRLGTFIGNEGTMIQTDAASNHGNSGGPMFLKSGSKYVWVGVNTYAAPDTHGVNFALSVRGVTAPSKYAMFEANPRGAAQALRRWYRGGATY